MKDFYKTNRFGKDSITVSNVESWNKIQKQLKNILLKNLSSYKIRAVVFIFLQLLLIFILNHINNSFYHVKI